MFTLIRFVLFCVLILTKRENMGFVFLLQTVHDGRQFMKYIDPHLGVPLPERDYGGNCLIYDPGNETDPFHNVWVRNK